MTLSTTPDWLKETTLLHDIKSLLNDTNSEEDQRWTFLQQLKMQTVLHNDGYSLLPLFIVFEQVIRDSAFFLQQASNEMRKIVCFPFSLISKIRLSRPTTNFGQLVGIKHISSL
jgi:hypothetical protein